MFNTPNKLTIARIFFALTFNIIYMFGDSRNIDLIASIVFVVIATSDFLDGYIARKFNQETDLGKMLDPIADKLLVVSSLFILVYKNRIGFFVPSIIVSREIIISGLRSMLSSDIFNKSKSAILDVSVLSKMKTCIQFIAIWLLLLNRDIFHIETHYKALLLAYISVAISLYTLISYIKIFIKNMK